MKVLIVFAHPEHKSLNYALHKEMVDELQKNGNEVKVTDLYASNWDAVLSRHDAPTVKEGDRFDVAAGHSDAYAKGVLPEEIKTEHEKLDWADILILQFPLWWFSLPAILKGWVERVYASGYAYNRGEHSSTRYGDRYGEGVFQGKRAMLVVTTGGAGSHYSDRGINGPIDDVLFPINHGILFYPGYTVLPPWVAFSAQRVHEGEEFEALAQTLRERMRTLDTTEPIPYRLQNYGDYKIPSVELVEGVESKGTNGFSLHLK